MTNTQAVPLNRLVQSKVNVRRTARTSGIDSLMASIAAHGLRQNLNVRPTTGGRFEVVAGRRRLIALKKLARLGTIASDAPVPCLILTEDENAAEISLAENELRLDMHPDDQCEAFRTLVDAGQPVEDIAARFGVTPAVVRQRLKLAAVSPKLRALYRAGETTLAHLMAVTLTDDHAAQEGAFAAAYSPDHIRRLLTDGTEEADSRLAIFVGLDAYTAAGSGVVTDLFNPESSYLTDAALLHTLALAKLSDVAKSVEAEGWAWVTTELTRDYATTYRRIYGEQDDEDGDNEGGTERFTREQMAMAGARLSVSYDGELEIDRGLVRREDCARPGAAEGGKAASSARPDYSAALLRELTAHRTAALRSELATRPDIALAAVVHGLVLSLRHAGSDSCLGLSLTSRSLERDVQATADCDANRRLENMITAWQTRLPEEPEALWRWCLAQPQDVLLDMLALLAALSIDAVEERSAPQRTAALTQSDRLAEALALDMAEHWQPGAAFLARLSKPVMAKAVAEAGDTMLAANLAVMKKDAAARYAATALAGKGWLPPALKAPSPADNAEADGEPDDAAEAEAA